MALHPAQHIGNWNPYGPAPASPALSELLDDLIDDELLNIPSVFAGEVFDCLPPNPVSAAELQLAVGSTSPTITVRTPVVAIRCTQDSPGRAVTHSSIRSDSSGSSSSQISVQWHNPSPQLAAAAAAAGACRDGPGPLPASGSNAAAIQEPSNSVAGVAGDQLLCGLSDVRCSSLQRFVVPNTVVQAHPSTQQGGHGTLGTQRQQSLHSTLSSSSSGGLRLPTLLPQAMVKDAPVQLVAAGNTAQLSAPAAAPAAAAPGSWVDAAPAAWCPAPALGTYAPAATQFLQHSSPAAGRSSPVQAPAAVHHCSGSLGRTSSSVEPGAAGAGATLPGHATLGEPSVRWGSRRPPKSTEPRGVTLGVTAAVTKRSSTTKPARNMVHELQSFRKQVVQLTLQQSSMLCPAEPTFSNAAAQLTSLLSGPAHSLTPGLSSSSQDSLRSMTLPPGVTPYLPV